MLKLGKCTLSDDPYNLQTLVTFNGYINIESPKIENLTIDKLYYRLGKSLHEQIKTILNVDIGVSDEKFK